MSAINALVTAIGEERWGGSRLERGGAPQGVRWPPGASAGGSHPADSGRGPLSRVRPISPANDRFRVPPWPLAFSAGPVHAPTISPPVIARSSTPSGAAAPTRPAPPLARFSG